MWNAKPFVDVEYVLNSPSFRVMSVEFNSVSSFFGDSGICSFPSIVAASAREFLGCEISGGVRTILHGNFFQDWALTDTIVSLLCVHYHR